MKPGALEPYHMAEKAVQHKVGIRIGTETGWRCTGGFRRSPKNGPLAEIPI